MIATIKQLMRLLGMMGLKQLLVGDIKRKGKIKRLSISIRTTNEQNIEHVYTLQSHAEEKNADSQSLSPTIQEELFPFEQEWNVSLMHDYIKKNYEKSHDYCIRLESQRDNATWSLADCENRWSELVEAVEKIRKTGKRAEDLENNDELFTRAISGYGYYPHLIPAAFAVAYCMDANESIQNNDFHHASFCMERAKYWLSDDSPHKELPEALQGRASAGGKARSEEHTIPVKQEFIRLLGLPPNPKGWKNRVSAASFLVKPIQEFIALRYSENIDERYPKRRIGNKDEEPGEKPEEDLYSKMLRWIREDDEVKAVYLANAKKKTSIQI